ncbi:MAG: DoxX family protein [Rhizobiaceae bacterium]|nr:DoxX family protein [Hyphomicrobiales bacterium]NRB31001.1 DoxX family protein [Rhizobiaceae bacterium]
MGSILNHLPRLFYILPAIAFAAAGVAKLMGVPAVHGSFEMMGLPSWFGYFIGLAEAAGAVGLLMARTRKLAAAGLIIIMIGAIYFHIAYAIPSALPATVLLILCALTIYWKWDRSASA